MRSLALFWVKLINKEVNFIQRPYINVASSFSLAPLDEDVEVDMSTFSSLLAHTLLRLFSFSL